MIWLLVILGLIVVVALAARRALQPARPAAQPRRQRLGADRGSAQAALGPHPEPRRERQGLRGARARDVRGRDRRRVRGPEREGPAEAAQAEGILEPGARPALRGRRGVPGAPGRRELPAAPDRARRDGEQGRRQPPGLQRHRADVQQHDADVPGRSSLAGPFGFTIREFFEVEDEAQREAPEVAF